MLPIIDPEFQAAMFPIGNEERRQLEANILEEGCREPLTLWQGLLLDGHNRYAICTKHGVPFETVETDLADRDAALNWIDRNQLGRRNLTPDQMRLVRGRRYNREKKQHGGERVASAQNDPLPEKTAERHAREAGVSPATIKRDGAAVAKIEKSPELTQAVQSGTLSLNLAAKAAEVLTPEHELPVLLHDFANLIAGVQAALDDGEITQSESDEVWREGELLIAAVYAVMHSIRQRVTRRPLRPRSMAQGEAMGRASGA